MDLSNIQVLVLAGQRAGVVDPLCEAFGVDFKVETSLLGRPMLSWVEATLTDVGLSQPYRISGYNPGHKGWLETESGDGPADSALKALRNIDRHCLMTTGDHPLLTPKMIYEFIGLSQESESDFCVGLVTEKVIKQAYPKTKRTYLRFSDEAVSGCNLFYIRNREGLKALEFWRDVQHLRKQPLKLARKVGVGIGLRFASGRLSLGQAFKEAGDKIGIQASPILLSDAEAAIDVDKVSDHTIVEEILRQRGTAIREQV